MVVVPEFVGEALQPGPRLTFWDLSLLPAVFYLAVPGYLVFLILGIPTIYFLYRWKRLGFGWFALFGVLYTSLAFAILGLCIYHDRSTYFITLKAYLQIWGVAGFFGGVLTRLIVFGPRRIPKRNFAASQEAQSL